MLTGRNCRLNFLSNSVQTMWKLLNFSTTHADRPLKNFSGFSETKLILQFVNSQE